MFYLLKTAENRHAGAVAPDSISGVAFISQPPGIRGERQTMSLYVQIPTDKGKIRQGIVALEWQLSQDIPDKDRQIFAQTLEAYKAVLDGSHDTQKEIII